MKRANEIERIVGKIEIQRVAEAELDVLDLFVASLGMRMLEHVGRWIDSDDVNVWRIGIERNAGADADFENAIARSKPETLD